MTPETIIHKSIIGLHAQALSIKCHSPNVLFDTTLEIQYFLIFIFKVQRFFSSLQTDRQTYFCNIYVKNIYTCYRYCLLLIFFNLFISIFIFLFFIYLSIHLFVFDLFIFFIVAETNRRRLRSITASTLWSPEPSILRARRSSSTPWVAIYWTMPFRDTTLVYSPTGRRVINLFQYSYHININIILIMIII